MFTMRRAVLLGGAAVHLAFVRPVSASSDLRAKMQILNDRDAQLVKNKRVSEVSQWEAMAQERNRFTTACNAGAIRDSVIDELYWMVGFYERPLDAAKRIRARTILVNLLEKARTDDETACIMSVITYFQLFDEVSGEKQN